MDYDTLKANLASWLDNEQLTSRLDTFITLTEAKLNRMLRVSEMVCEATTLAIDGQEYYTLPEDFLGMRHIKINDKDVDYLTPEAMDSLPFRNITASTNSEHYYTIVSNRYRIIPATATDDDIRIFYYRKLPPIGNLNSTNWLLTSYPDIYLYGCLVEANIYLYDDAKTQQMLGAFNAAVDQLKQADKMDRWSGSSMVTRYET